MDLLKVRIWIAIVLYSEIALLNRVTQRPLPLAKALNKIDAAFFAQRRALKLFRIAIDGLERGGVILEFSRIHVAIQ